LADPARSLISRGLSGRRESPTSHFSPALRNRSPPRLLTLRVTTGLSFFAMLNSNRCQRTGVLDISRSFARHSYSAPAHGLRPSTAKLRCTPPLLAIEDAPAPQLYFTPFPNYREKIVRCRWLLFPPGQRPRQRPPFVSSFIFRHFPLASNRPSPLMSASASFPRQSKKRRNKPFHTPSLSGKSESSIRFRKLLSPLQMQSYKMRPLSWSSPPHCSSSDAHQLRSG